MLGHDVASAEAVWRFLNALRDTQNLAEAQQRCLPDAARSPPRPAEALTVVGLIDESAECDGKPSHDCSEFDLAGLLLRDPDRGSSCSNKTYSNATPLLARPYRGIRG